jgi:hypothetical protein
MVSAYLQLKKIHKLTTRKRTFQILLLVIIFIGLEHIIYKKMLGFAPYKIICTKKIDIENHADNDVTVILNQPFRYLDKGLQFFAFLSEDGQYVLKFVNHTITTWRLLFISWEAAKFAPDLFQSCELTYHQLKKETELLAIHLKPDESEQHFVTLFDHLGNAHRVNLNATSYLLQKKVNRAKENPITRSDIQCLVKTIKNRQTKGIINQDPKIPNVGFHDSLAIEIDIGAFSQPHAKDLPSAIKEEQIKWKKRLKKYDPALAEYFTLQFENN